MILIKTEKSKEYVASILSNLLLSACKPYDNGGYIVLDDCNNWFLRWDEQQPNVFWVEFRDEASRPLEQAFANWVKARNGLEIYSLNKEDEEAEADKHGYIRWLQNTLIADLRESGSDAMADEFETCIKYMNP